MSEEKFLRKLPDLILEKTIGFSQRDLSGQQEKLFLKTRLPSSDVNEIEDKLKKRFNFTSARTVFKKRIRRKGCPRNSCMSNTQKRALGLYSISRKGLTFKELLPLYSCWEDYMKDLLNLKLLKESQWNGDLTSSLYEDFTQVLWKADYHGAYIKVSRSTCPSFVGIEGILIFESKNIIRLLGQDNEVRCVPKGSCEFSMKVGDYLIKFIGKHFMVKPSERSVKKVKPGKFYDL